MAEEKMTIHKGLSELKVLDSRINRKIGSTAFCMAKRHSSSKVNGIDVSEFVSQAVSDNNSINALIDRRNAIKRAIVLSNAITKVTIAGDEYTVAEAIEMNNHGVELLKNKISEMKSQYSFAVSVCEKYNTGLEDRADKHVIEMFATKDVKNLSDEAKEIKKAFIEQNTYSILTPFNIKEEIDKVEEFICLFESEVDSALSVSNAVTTIEIDY